VALGAVAPLGDHEHSHRKDALGDYSPLFSFLSNYDWSCVYINNTIAAAVDSSINVILQDMGAAIPRGVFRKPTFLHWFFHILIYHIRKHNYFRADARKVKTSIIVVNFQLPEAS
jgi:hypothetical protein